MHMHGNVIFAIHDQCLSFFFMHMYMEMSHVRWKNSRSMSVLSWIVLLEILGPTSLEETTHTWYTVPFISAVIDVDVAAPSSTVLSCTLLSPNTL